MGGGLPLRAPQPQRSHLVETRQHDGKRKLIKEKRTEQDASRPSVSESIYKIERSLREGNTPAK